MVPLVAGVPRQRPVDHELVAGLRHRLDHPVGVRHARGERFLQDDVHVIGCDPLDPVGVFGGDRTEDDDVRVGLLQTSLVVPVDLVVRQAEVVGGVLEPKRRLLLVLVTDGDDPGVGIGRYFAQVVAHVEVSEVDACDCVCHDIARLTAVENKRPVEY